MAASDGFDTLANQRDGLAHNDWWRFGTCATAGILPPFCFLNLYAFKRPEGSPAKWMLRDKVKGYAQVYAHFPLTAPLAASTLGLQKMGCAWGASCSDQRASEYYLIAWGVALVTLGGQHAFGVSADTSWVPLRRSAVRLVCGLLLVAVALNAAAVSCVGHFAIVAGVCVVQVGGLHQLPVLVLSMLPTL